MYTKGNTIEKGIYLILSVVKRFFCIRKAIKAEYILIHRELLPVGPPILEWIICRLFRKKIIYDFDDAIWLTDNLNENWLIKKFRWRSKVSSICRWSYKVSAGNEYLADYARKFNSNVVVNPTTIDTVKYHTPVLYQGTSHLLVQAQIDGVHNLSTDSTIIGWTGSHSTLKYLEALEPVLKKLEDQHHGIAFLVIADKPPQLHLKKMVFRKWSKETEISDLMLADIGIMPLSDDAWSKGKCGFKVLQYMALEIPCLASPVGVNTTIIQHGVNGFLCNSEDDWLTYFNQLIMNTAIRRKIGENGRTTVEDQYSVCSNTSNFLSLFA